MSYYKLKRRELYFREGGSFEYIDIFMEKEISHELIQSLVSQYGLIVFEPKKEVKLMQWAI